MKTEEEKKEINEDIYLKFAIISIKRNPVYIDKESYKGRVDYSIKIRNVCKELMEEKEYANA